MIRRKRKVVKFYRQLFGDRLARGYPFILPGQVQSTLWTSVGSSGWPPLFLDQTDGQRGEKNFLETPFPLPVGLDLPLRTPLQDLMLFPAVFQSCYHNYTLYKTDSRHFLNHQQTLERCFMQWKIYLLRRKCKCRSDSKLKNFYYCVVLFQFAEYQLLHFETTNPWAFACIERLIAQYENNSSFCYNVLVLAVLYKFKRLLFTANVFSISFLKLPASRYLGSLQAGHLSKMS